MRAKLAFLFLTSFIFLNAGPTYAFDHSDWEALLKRYVKDGVVDYKNWSQDQSGLRSYLNKIQSYSLQDFSKDSREDRMALWINAYNAFVIQEILNHYPIKSVQEIPDFWSRKFVIVATLDYSLSDIRDQVFRKSFRDERALLALVSGYQSSGPLRNEAYEGTRLVAQLTDQMGRFLSDSRYNQIQKGSKKIKLSPLLREFGDDFILGYGVPEVDDQFKPKEMALLGFVRTHIQDPEVVEWLGLRKYKIKYLKEDWSLNEYYENKT